MIYNIIIVSVMLCASITLSIAIFALRHRTTNGAQLFSMLMFFLSIYILGYSLELSSSNIHAMLFWSKIEYIGTLIFPTLFLLFVIQFTGLKKWLTRKNIMLLFIFPLFMLAAKFLDDQLHLIYSTVAIDGSGPISLLTFTRGPLYIVNIIYHLVIVTLGNFILLIKRRYASDLYRKQSAIMLSAALIIYLVFIAYLIGVTPIPSLKSLDINPFAYSIWGIAIGLAIFRHGLFNLAPIARDALIEMLSDGVVVLDANYRIVDANPEAQKIFGWRIPPAGEFAENRMKGWITPEFLDGVDRPAKIETCITNDNITNFYEVTISNLRENQGKIIGFLILVHDISERKNIEKELHELSLVDELTGLTNRRGFKMLANQFITMTNRMELKAALFYFDLDNLKWINDNLGHAMGDEALKEMACILKRTFRSSDIVARLGGDEFVVLAIATIENSVETMLKRIQEQIGPCSQGQQKFPLSFSIGVACYDWKNPRPVDLLMEEADRKMYEKKQAKKVAVQNG